MQLEYKAIRWPPCVRRHVRGPQWVRIHPPIKSQPPAEVQPPRRPALRPQPRTSPPASRPGEIIVTGSRCAPQDLTTPAPVTVISATRITASGVGQHRSNSAELPSRAGSLNTNVQQRGDGQTQINLRDLVPSAPWAGRRQALRHGASARVPRWT